MKRALVVLVVVVLCAASGAVGYLVRDRRQEGPTASDRALSEAKLACTAWSTAVSIINSTPNIAAAGAGDRVDRALQPVNQHSATAARLDAEWNVLNRAVVAQRSEVRGGQLQSGTNATIYAECVKAQSDEEGR